MSEYRSGDLRAKSRKVPVISMFPEWPSVRCDRCRTEYTIPEQNGLVVGNCPNCGHDRFSTRLVGDVPAQMFDLRGVAS